MAVVWAVSTLTLLVLAGLLPDFQLQSADGDTFTRTALTAAAAAGAFGLLGALVWPLIVRALLLVPALVLGLLVFFLNGSLLLVALWLIPDGRGVADPETAVVVAAVMSAVASATSTALAVRDDDAYRRRLYRLTGRTRPRRPEDAPEQAPGTVFLQLDGVGHHVLRGAVADGLMPTVAGWLDTGHRLTPGAPTGRARPARASSASCTVPTRTCPPSAGTRRTPAGSWCRTVRRAPWNSSAGPCAAPGTADS